MKKNILHSSKSNEWYTPKWIIDIARQTMGHIDLDPASSSDAQKIVNARNWYGNEAFQHGNCLGSDGLDRAWFGNVWLNPPYGKTGNKSNAGIWLEKLIADYNAGLIDQAMFIVNAVPDRSWFHGLWNFALCFLYARVRFVAPTGRHNSPTHPSVLGYMGSNDGMYRFKQHAQKHGHVVLP